MSDRTQSLSVELQEAIRKLVYELELGRQHETGGYVGHDEAEEFAREYAEEVIAPFRERLGTLSSGATWSPAAPVLSEEERERLGGDEEDWPAVLVARGALGIRIVTDPTQRKTLELSEHPDTRRYLPAAVPSEPSVREAELAGTRDRADKAEGERDAAQMPLTARDNYLLNRAEENGRRANNAERAIEDLAAELKEQENASEALRAAALRSGTATAANDALVHASARDAFLVALSLCREKAAALKGDSDGE